MDHNDSQQIQRKLMEVTRKLQAMALSVGEARSVKEYDSERRRALLSKFVAPLLRASMTATAAEHESRATPAYLAALDELQGQLKDCESIISEWNATMAAYDSCRSLLSYSKETLRNLDG